MNDPGGSHESDIVQGMSQARLRTILDSEPECVKTVNAEGELIDLNRAGLQMMGVSDIAQVRGTHLSMLVDPRDWDAYQTNLNAVFKGETKHWEFRCNSPTGDQRWMEQTAGPVRSPENPDVVTEMVAITRDITDRKVANHELLTAIQEAKDANTAKTNFLANMSHEIRTPMNGILGMANMLSETELSEDQGKLLAVIQASGESLLRILNDILDLAKVEAGRIELELVPFCMNDHLEELQRLHAANATKKEIQLKIVGCEHMNIQRFGDPTRIAQVLNNLLDNAVKFTSSGTISGQVTCGSCLESCQHGNRRYGPEHVHVRIQDTGIGMTTEQIGRIFDAFTQAESATTRRFGGTGLGLTIARTLTELMNGTISVESQPGKGTTFEVTLPLPPIEVQFPESHVTRDRQPEDALPLGPQVNILAVEDGEVNQVVLAHILKKLNTDYTMVANGKQAVEAFKTGKFDLILMDIHMPIMDGISALSEIRRIEQEQGTERIPVAAVTASVTENEIEKYKEYGFSHCIAKPTKPSMIQDVIKSLDCASSSKGCTTHGR